VIVFVVVNKYLDKLQDFQREVGPWFGGNETNQEDSSQ